MQDALDGSDGGSRGHRRTTTSGRNQTIAAALGAVALAGAAIAAMAWLSHHRSGPLTTAPATPPPPAVSARMDLPVVVIGADCAVLGAAAVDQTGAPAYCARGVADTTVWSVQPGALRSSSGPAQPGADGTGISAPMTP